MSWFKKKVVPAPEPSFADKLIQTDIYWQDHQHKSSGDKSIQVIKTQYFGTTKDNAYMIERKEISTCFSHRFLYTIYVFEISKPYKQIFQEEDESYSRLFKHAREKFLESLTE